VSWSGWRAGDARPPVTERAQENRAGRLIAATRRLNRHPALVGAAKGARERMLGETLFADRLAGTRSGPAAELLARELAALRSDEPGVLGEIGFTALQAWQRLAERQGRGRGEVDVAILFADLTGFSTWALDVGDGPAIALLRAVAAQIEPPIIDRRGEVVKRLGDGLMAALPDAASAVEAAFLARERAATIEIAGYAPLLRVGIHLGRPRKLGHDYFGVDVNVAARLVEAAGPGEIVVSDRTLQSLDARAVTATRLRFTAKGVPADLAAHAVSRAGRLA
jgi:adenylate cyclase